MRRFGSIAIKVQITIVSLAVTAMLGGCGAKGDTVKANSPAPAQKTQETAKKEETTMVKKELDPTEMLKGFQLFKQSTVKIQAGKVIYVDPYMIDGEPHDADIIFITHSHSDHLSPKDIDKIKKDGTAVVVTADGVEKIKAAGITKVTEVAPLKEYQAEGFKFKTVPMYNIGKDFHQKQKNWVGYVISINNLSYYFAGDIDNIPELKDVKADVFFIPVGGKFTMTFEEAAKAINELKPKVVVPMHYGDISGAGSPEDGKKFVDLLDKSIRGVVLKK